MIAFAKLELSSGDNDRRRLLVPKMAQTWPEEPALALVYAVTSATESIADKDNTKKNTNPLVTLGYKLSALVAADVHAVHSMGLIPSKSSDLLQFWRRVDPLFLRLN